MVCNVMLRIWNHEPQLRISYCPFVYDKCVFRKIIADPVCCFYLELVNSEQATICILERAICLDSRALRHNLAIRDDKQDEQDANRIFQDCSYVPANFEKRYYAHKANCNQGVKKCCFSYEHPCCPLDIKEACHV